MLEHQLTEENREYYLWLWAEFMPPKGGSVLNVLLRAFPPHNNLEFGDFYALSELQDVWR